MPVNHCTAKGQERVVDVGLLFVPDTQTTRLPHPFTRSGGAFCYTRLRELWYRYGDSNPGPVAENHVS